MIVKFYGNVAEQTGGEKTLEPGPCQDLGSLICELGRRYGESFGELLLSGEFCFFLVNGQGVMTTGGLDTPLKQGDRIEVLPLIEAG